MESTATPPIESSGGHKVNRLRPQPLGPLALATAIALIYLIWAPVSIDLQAHIFRVGLFDGDGFALFNTHWYQGHYTLDYSVLYPPLAWLFGLRLLAAVSLLAAVLCFDRLTVAGFGRGSASLVASLWFALGATTSLFTGRLPYALGLAIALASLLAFVRGRTVIAIVVGVLATLASPVAGLFLALAGGAIALDKLLPRSGKSFDLRAGVRAAAPSIGLFAAGFVPILILAWLFPEGGTQPYKLQPIYIPVLVALPIIFFVGLKRSRPIAIGTAVYALGLLTALLVETPVGSNAARLGAMFAGPILALLLLPKRWWIVVVLALPLMASQLYDGYRDTADVIDDPAATAGFYKPLNAFLARNGAELKRTEVVFTKAHGEAAYVANRFPIARGWERQLDTLYNPLFYEPNLSRQKYQQWLLEKGISYVALSTAHADFSARAEAALVRSKLPYLRPVFRSKNWQVFSVDETPGLASSGLRLTKLGVDSFAAHARLGSSLLRVHYTPYWRVRRGAACVRQGPSGWTQIETSRAGPVELETSFSPLAPLRSATDCRR